MPALNDLFVFLKVEVNTSYFLFELEAVKEFIPE